ncbi:oxidoreductase [Rhodoferax sp. PAMC 29310]|uniref:oxidoreductase n=1 Tax=Rhodoferax sp. PAMC 29310 TaxID=2822760 RepID=UPI001B341E04|nr:oxidoreductase [Rhodoferax sp. PAMC 29310]
MTSTPHTQGGSAAPIQVALIGYGNAGRIFHAPLISGVPGLQLACICSSKPEAVHVHWPQVRVLPTPEAVFADASIEVVVIATSNTSHHPLAKAALLAGKHVVVDKPFTVSLPEAEDLLATAKAQNRVITVFQNRRFDADFLALQQVLASGQLGRMVHLESHFDRYRPDVPSRWREEDLPGSGLWFDLGAHLLDQALQLLGEPDALQVELACQRTGAKTNDWFHAQLRYESRHPGLRVILHASALVPELGPRWTVHGAEGSFVKYGLDTQEDALKTGRRPQLNALQDWGIDPMVGQVVRHEIVGEIRQRVSCPAPDLPGNYLLYYANLRDHLRGQAKLTVTPEQIRSVMHWLTLGEQSAREDQFVSR